MSVCTRLSSYLCCAFMVVAATTAIAAAPQRLQIYFIDVEGGQSTLVVTPAGETLLIDAGFPGSGASQAKTGDVPLDRARDPHRILAAARHAGVTRIDYLLATHFHRDHIGGVAELAQLIPIGTYIDYGLPVRTRGVPADPLDALADQAYATARAKGKRLRPNVGDKLPLKGVDATVVSSNRAVLARPLAGAGYLNSECRNAPVEANDPDGENPRSTGLVLQFGSFRFLDVGDLTGLPLYELACPLDRVGPVDLYLVAHHGGADAADAGTLAAFKPRAAVVNNAPRKGGQRETLRMLRAAEAIESWQLHFSPSGEDDNAPAERIANLDEQTSHWLKVTASADGSFDVTNARTGATRAYAAHSR